MEGQDCFTASKLRGHRASVTCLQADADQQNLLSGSDDKTVRLWDLRINRSTKCMLGCFGSPIEAVKFASSNIVYAACANAVYSFDLRYDGVLTKVPLAELSMGEGPDEISNLAINNKGDMLAAAMDSGVINLVPIRGNGTFCENSGSTRYKRLTRVHNNIISTVSFKKNNPRELLSGGFDYTGCLWEVDRGRPKISTNFQSMPTPLVEGADPDEERNPLQIINPPFVMSMNYIMDGRCVVAALGDGTVRILNGKDLTYNTHIDAHHCMISGLYTDNFHIVTGGTDSTVHAFKLQQVAEPTKVATSGGGKKKTAAPVPLSSLKLEIVKLFSIQHDAKINAVVAVFGPDSVITTSDSIAPATTTTDNVEHSEGNVKESAASEATSGQMRKVYIADISNDITFYTNRP